MWTLLSFTGRFDPEYFNLHVQGAAVPVALPGEISQEQKRKNAEAAQARAKVRLARKYARLRTRLQAEAMPKWPEAKPKWGQGKGKSKGQKEGQQIRLSKKMEDLLEAYDSGKLQEEANRLTKISGNGRLRKNDGTYVDIGGNTGGFVRTILDDWAPPDLSEFD